MLSSSLAMCGGDWCNTNPWRSRMQLVIWLAGSIVRIVADCQYQDCRAVLWRHVIELPYTHAYKHTLTTLGAKSTPVKCLRQTAVNRYKSQASHHNTHTNLMTQFFVYGWELFGHDVIAPRMQNLMIRNMHTHSCARAITKISEMFSRMVDDARACAFGTQRMHCGYRRYHCMANNLWRSINA